MPTPILSLVLPLLLALAVLLAWFRLALWRARAPAEARARGWRLTLLFALQPVTAGLLYLTLMPPPRPGSAGTLIVATADGPRLAALTDTLVALPEAPVLPGAERVPDLATALRRHPGTTGLRIIGQGLPPRDQFATAGLPLAFDPAPLPRGLTALSLPPQTSPGAGFRIGGSVTDVAGGHAELIDPAGKIIATTPLSASGTFALIGTARVAGPADFSLRIRDAANRLVETAPIPVIAAVQPPPRVLVIAGAAGPDLKYLRRWANDAGVDLKASIAAGRNFDIGNAPARIDTTSLAGLDLLILDERSWASLSAAQRAAVVAAVRAGLGALLRVTGPVSDATRREWAAFGLLLTDTQLSLHNPELTRFALAAPGPNSIPLFTDAANSPVAVWRGLGRGRIGLWPVTDLYTLALAGDAARHAGIWSGIFATLARPQADAAPATPTTAYPGQRVALCNLSFPASVLSPDGRATALIADHGCAAFFPRQPGWHSVQGHAFLVTTASPGITAAENQLATWQLENSSPPAASAATSTANPVPGASGPWFTAWLALSALLWWFERASFGRAGANPA